jgi:plasmid stabilization system protein ParE
MAVELILTPDEACLEVIRRAPETCSKVYADYRRALLRRFPYAIFYEYAEAVITVYGVLHTSQDPAKWRDRLA